MLAARAFPPLLGALACAACLSAPRTEDWLAVGFRTPEQAFRTFQTAVRADAPELEYRCFSRGFVARNGISKLAWREAREALRRDQPFLRVGIARAEVEAPPVVDGKHAKLRASAFGTLVDVELVREEFGELWSGETRVFDEYIDLERASGVQEAAGGKRLFYGRLPLPDDAPALISEIRLGSEWKIDALAEAPKERDPPDR